jgi:hypothetical protein
VIAATNRQQRRRRHLFRASSRETVEGGEVMCGKGNDATFRRAGRDVAEQLGEARAGDAEGQAVHTGSREIRAAVVGAVVVLHRRDDDAERRSATRVVEDGALAVVALERQCWVERKVLAEHVLGCHRGGHVTQAGLGRRP